MRYLVTMVLLAASTALAAEIPLHAHDVGGGWYECDRGFVMQVHACVDPGVVLANRFEVSALPSAGDGAPITRSSEPTAVYRTTPQYYSWGGWHYEPALGFGGNLIRVGPAPMERTVVRVPW